MRRDGPVVLYGATGYTGRLVAAELARRGVDAVLAGRDAARLAALRADLRVEWPLRAAPVDDLVALRAAVAGAGVVVSCAGPFTRLGAPLVDAALAAGAHHLDTTGEQRYVRQLFEHLDGPARANGAAVVPAAGFDYVPGDLLAAVVARGRGPLRELRLVYDVHGLGATRGTLRSAVAVLAERDVVHEDGGLRPGAALPERGTFTFPAPVGRRATVRYPGGEQVTVPRHVDTRRVVERITAASLVPGVPAAALPPAAAGLAALARVPLAAGALEAAIDRLPEGPGEGARRATRFTIACEAEALDGSVATGVLRGHDLYGLTAVIAVEAAVRLAAGEAPRPGVLAPAEAFRPAEFLAALGEHGVSVALDGAR
jgi:short subunit dehydrogenase-like uncharacterized protein